MTVTEAIVTVFGMFFGTVWIGMFIHQDLERDRLKRGYYDDKPKLDETESQPSTTVLDDEIPF